MQHKFTLPLLFVHYNEPYGVSLWLNLVFIIFIIFIIIKWSVGLRPLVEFQKFPNFNTQTYFWLAGFSA